MEETFWPYTGELTSFDGGFLIAVTDCATTATPNYPVHRSGAGLSLLVSSWPSSVLAAALLECKNGKFRYWLFLAAAYILYVPHDSRIS